MNLPSLQNVSHAKLPAVYEAAQRALAECSRVDECQDWADKMAAIASYARQADDPTLERYAMRIKARAIQRGGKLQEHVQRQPGKRTDLPDGTAPTRLQELETETGISRDQRITMLRVANVPDNQFTAMVESDNPPTITALAELGKQCRGSATAEEFKYATHALATLRRFAEFARATDPQRAAAGVQPKEIASARVNVAEVDRWLDSFVVHLMGDLQ